MTYHVKDGAKVIDAPCECQASKDYYSPKAVAERKEAEEKELVRLGLKLGKPKKEAKA